MARPWGVGAIEGRFGKGCLLYGKQVAGRTRLTTDQMDFVCFVIFVSLAAKNLLDLGNGLVDYAHFSE